ALGVALGGAVLGAIGLGAGYWYYSRDLPTVEILRAYEPDTVTVVTDSKGQVLGEIFEERRYVVAIDAIPKHVQDAFIASEDANFWNHAGIDYMGIVRAMGRNAVQGRMAQGASTITQQVARNFLLTKDKKLERKIKEVILSWRIEDTYTKEHILYLYLNEIFLGAQSYGVEAASRSFFDKGVKDLTVAEAAILAGLPQRPSDYAPNRHWDNAKGRQKYVLGQMLDKGYIDRATHDAALAEHVAIAPVENAFREQAPWFTEHVRRYLVGKYGEEAVLQQGLQVTTTCDLDLQRVAQKAVTDGVDDADMRMGFRRAGLEHLADAAAIAERRAAHDLALRTRAALVEDPAGRLPVPERSTLAVGGRYPAVLLEVSKTWARVGIGTHEAVVPLAWSDWVYDPDPARSWRSRVASDFTDPVDVDGDHKPDGALLQPGDVVKVDVAALSTLDPALVAAFAGTPGAAASLVAARLYQNAEAEGALFSMDLNTGAVRAMVGGSDFSETQFNRAVQSRRQVGSTFKPIVYAAAINSRKITAASLIPDAPIAFATEEDTVWKPSNYSNDYLGNITIRRALALSRNTVTVRVLESIDPGMNGDVVYDFARALGIGGLPTHALPADRVSSPQNDLLCPWTREKRDSTICMDHFPPRTDPDKSNTAHRAALKPDEEHSCRACDYSMALGSASLTMDELVRAYSAFPTGGKLVEPHYVVEVKDRHGKVLEAHAPKESPQVIDAGVASITTWLLQGVVSEGTGNLARRELGLNGLGGKTGTTNDEKDAWFVGFTPDIITSVWVGFD
nr:transglycosylase domain-containing protein [Deltaproteobacteria bacterium]